MAMFEGASSTRRVQSSLHFRSHMSLGARGLAAGDYAEILEARVKASVHVQIPSISMTVGNEMKHLLVSLEPEEIEAVERQLGVLVVVHDEGLPIASKNG
mmetsp:Transcript_3867/g.7818  ORF Transcript_3867/g.7818 Transcript_3867/m.7818 type:complete len:100 (+) Transcript_3867:141-440(+)